MAGTETKTSEKTALDVPWNVVVYDDPVNLMDYVTRVFMKIFGYPEQRAKILMMEVHTQGRSVVWTGARERAEHYTHQLQACQLQATMEKPE
jgi:ATP-dependent Clp protease adaptor protein ClpS